MDMITMNGNTGTYLDAPYHRCEGGGDLASLDLRTLVGLRAEVFHLRDAWDVERRGIEAVTLADRHLRDAAVLLDTGWSASCAHDPARGRRACRRASDALAEVPAQGARFTAAPPAMCGFGTFPVRAFATVPASS
ncbi:cyclase family protein [Microbacterium oxydans]|nr:cyclase family protein [Microbacterium oxydans]